MELLLCGLVLILIDFVRLNWDNEDRSAHCPCFNAPRRARARVRGLFDSLDILLEYPRPLTVGLAAHNLGRLLGLLAGRAFFRVPLDAHYLEYADSNMSAHGCVLPADRLVLKNNVLSCPYAAHLAAGHG